MTGSDSNTQDGHPTVTTHPLLGVADVLLGALIATCTCRSMSTGLADIRGALHLGVDEGSWINTAFNASMMFIGAFSVYLGGSLAQGECFCLRMDLHLVSKVPIQYRQVTVAPAEARLEAHSIKGDGL